MLKLLSFFYGMSLPFTSVLALNGWFTLPVIMSLICFIFISVFYGHRSNKNNLFVIIFMLVSVVISSFISFFGDMDLNNKYLLSHFLSYIFVFIFFYYTSGRVMVLSLGSFISGSYIGLLITLVFGVLEFFLANFGWENVLSSIPRNTREIYLAEAFGIIRVRSLMDESGFLALYLCIFGPLLYTLKVRYKGVRLKCVVVVLYVFNIILTFSTSALIAFGIILPITVLIFKRSISNSNLVLIVYFIFAFLIFLISFLVFDIFLLDILFSKVETGNGRWDVVSNSVAVYVDNIGVGTFFGFGPGYFGKFNIDSVMSFALLVLFELGLIGFIGYLAVFIFAFKKVYEFPVVHRPYLAFSIFSSFFFYMFISNYWFPWLWVLLAFIINLSMRRDLFHYSDSL